MKSFIRKLSEFIYNTLDFHAPYCVINREMKKEHFCWTWKAALQWMACYDAESFGVTQVFNFRCELIAAKGN